MQKEKMDNKASEELNLSLKWLKDNNAPQYVYNPLIQLFELVVEHMNRNIEIVNILEEVEKTIGLRLKKPEEIQKIIRDKHDEINKLYQKMENIKPTFDISNFLSSLEKGEDNAKS